MAGSGVHPMRRAEIAGAAVTYIEVPGGGHSDVVVPNLPGAFEFMAQQKGVVATTKQ